MKKILAVLAIIAAVATSVFSEPCLRKYNYDLLCVFNAYFTEHAASTFTDSGKLTEKAKQDMSLFIDFDKWEVVSAYDLSYFGVRERNGYAVVSKDYVPISDYSYTEGTKDFTISMKIENNPPLYFMYTTTEGFDKLQTWDDFWIASDEEYNLGIVLSKGDNDYTYNAYVLRNLKY